MNWQLYVKGIVTGIGSSITAALGLIPPHTTTWIILTCLSAGITTATTIALPNAPKPDIVV
jgi:hypothetical protein